MRWRLLRRCLLFALLGLVTSVAVAWGVALSRARSPFAVEHLATGVAVVDGFLVRVSIWGRPGVRSEKWALYDTSAVSRMQANLQADAGRLEEIGPEAFDKELAETRMEDWRLSGRRIDRRAARGPPVKDVASGGTFIARESAGWPFLALRSTVRADRGASEEEAAAAPPTPSIGESIRGAIKLPWRLPGSPPWAPAGIILPVEPRPGLLANTILYGALWFVILLIPRAIRRRIRRARGRCPKCGYSLTGQSAPGCPECGAGREALAPA